MSGNKGAIVLSFIAGGVIGAGLALLYAPATGAETRKRIKEGVSEGVDTAKARLDEGVGKVREIVDTAKVRFDEGVGLVRGIAAEKSEDVKTAYASGKEAFLKGRDRLLKEV